MTALAILCSGQGSQHPAMFERLAGHPAADALLNTATTILGYDPLAQARATPLNTLYENHIAQPLVCSAILATWAVIAPWLPRPRVILGYSVGELAAYGCAGAMDAAQTLRLAQQRAALMDAATAAATGLIAILGLDRTAITRLCHSHAAHIAIINGPDHFVLGAPTAQLSAIETAALAQRATRAVRLRVGVAAHTPLLRNASLDFETALKASTLRDPAVAVLAGVTGAAVTTHALAITTLADQLCATVDWQACMQSAYEMGARVFLELGPGQALTRLLRDAYPSVAARAVDEFHRLDGVRDWVQKQLA